ncbi:PQQ-dependent sugar dehydrogenase [Mycolicibacterium diernhoferi]|uniref:Gluconolaconase n=3 Tax=Mycolicibacterium diernhoferi TaxID=1801 RepID=A0A1Q4HH64_9MYCO|nr:gluconolaconase [Mycolicibacterium diernhoferi]OJZ66876.1 gluconolaconase [Mycolicibacterium diernhoferi]PEG51988.1 gluconolaconase [Mycolicibacterium diernhoferi]QYL23067.1 gluconolaconase [Mycolicibacterium diernhoferi]
MPAWADSLRLIGGLAGAALVAACSTEAPAPGPPTVADTSSPAPVSTGLAEVTVTVPDGMDQPPFDQPRRALIPRGWTLEVWARTSKPRLAAWAPDGKLLVSIPSTGQVLSMQPGRGAEVLLDGLTQPHGLTFAGDTLYVAESDRVDAYSYRDGSAADRRTIAGGLPDARSPDLRGAYSHALKSVAVGPDGAVYFSIGSTGNISASDRDADPPRATIMRVPAGGSEMEAFATGVRNGTGLAIAPDGSVWTAVNNRDNVADPDTGQVRPDYVDNHPPESVARLTPGRELGWPYCNPDGGPADLALIRDVQTNPDGKAMNCAALPRIEQSLAAHSAPLGMSFTVGQLPAPYDSGALIGVHGSWNRQNPQAPEVSFFDWRDGTLGNQQTLVGGFQTPDGNRWGRPVAAVSGPDGAVYITDDYADAVYRLAPPG